MLILIIIYFQAYQNSEKEFLHQKLFINIVRITFIMLALDIFSRFDGKPDTIYYYINHIANFMVFALSPVLPSFWLLYVHYQIFQEEVKLKKMIYPLLIINGFNLIMLILSQFYGWYYYIDGENIYHRGLLYWIGPLIAVSLLILASLIIFTKRKSITERYYFSLVFFALPPLLSIVIQSVFYGVSLILNSIVLSTIVLFNNIQNRNIYIDYLTGLNNRKKIEIYLKNRIALASKDKSFSAIMIDLNAFKTINDTYGHDEGDVALQTAARILKNCLRSRDFIGRFGGDEFFAVLEISDRTEMEEVVSRIEDCFAAYNKTSHKPYSLSASMGYDIYDYNKKMTIQDFQKHIDKLMYENKKRFKEMQAVLK